MNPKARIAALVAACAVAMLVVLLRRDRATPTRDHLQSVEQPSANAPETPPSVAPSQAAPAPAPPPPAEASHRPNTEDEFMRELVQLESTDKEAALALARKGETWYPSTGKAAEARKAMIVTLLADLNRMDEARSLARGFMAAFPGSEYLPLVQGATGIHPRPHGPRGVVY